MKTLLHKLSVFLRMAKTYRNSARITLYRLNLAPAAMVVKARDGSRWPTMKFGEIFCRNKAVVPAL